MTAVGGATAAPGSAAAAGRTTENPAATGLPANLAALTIGDTVATREVLLTRDSLVRYAGASGDFNPIHYRDDTATAVGLPGVIAHGMLTMGVAVQAVVDWLGDPGRVLDYQTRFTRMVPVHPERGARLTVTARVGALSDAVDGPSEAGSAAETSASAATARIDLTVEFDGQTVLGKAQVLVRLDR